MYHSPNTPGLTGLSTGHCLSRFWGAMAPFECPENRDIASRPEENLATFSRTFSSKSGSDSWRLGQMAEPMDA